MTNEFEFRKIMWRAKTPDPIVESFWSWGNMVALPQELQDRIDAAWPGQFSASS